MAYIFRQAYLEVTSKDNPFSYLFVYLFDFCNSHNKKRGLIKIY